ncbi:ABC-type transport system involved in multi-copper enzyme maturation permease subunit [Labedella gwakjiensis]|uniref:ABC transporter permease n=1 Tax=Labedella gwakjiensis TaxID=390269 RepID=A0A2P8GR21_9MICO|nr:ABC transporter permease [Labedella gwakjiensis]PSL36423.1 ABC-type transport system involved in multi-copper enzyme maturation permease subunit [Labedella gwakjiensis]RUQ85649.1 ABC transporter permease [Labedella gwakjiensis]
MIPFAHGVRVVVALELAQRVRGIALYVLLGLFTLLVAVTTALLWLVDSGTDNGGFLFSTIVYFVLLLGTLLAPALSGAAINGDRDAGTLATTQVTLVSTTQIVVGTFLASWLTSLAFLVVSLPFLLSSFALGSVPAHAVVASILVLLVELAVVSAVGVGLSAVITRPLFSVAATYLVVAGLSVGTLIAFGLAGTAVQTEVRSTYIGIDYETYPEEGSTEPPVCLPPEVTTYQTPRYDLVWGILAANPYVVLADAASGEFDADGNPSDLFSQLAVGVRGAQLPPDTETVYDECEDYGNGYPIDDGYRTSEEIWNSTTPSWFVGLAAHVLIGAGLLAWGVARTRTPARRLPRGQRIA